MSDYFVANSSDRLREEGGSQVIQWGQGDFYYTRAKDIRLSWLISQLNHLIVIVEDRF